MKKLLALLLSLMMVFALSACGGEKGPSVMGTWKAVETETETEYGLGIEFSKDGKLRYGLTEDVLNSLMDEEMTEKEKEDAQKGMDMLMSIEYKIKSDTEMEVTAKALFGLAKEATTVQYKLDGDTLTFDGATYERVK